MSKKTVILTPRFRVAFPHVFRPNPFGGGEPKYRLTMVFPKGTDLSALKAAAKAAAEEKWGANIPKGLRSPFRDGAEKAHVEGFGPDVIFISASSMQKPGLVDRVAGPDGKPVPIEAETDFYGGCFARATLTAFAYDNSGNKGVSFGLQNIQKLADGPSFTGRRKPEEDFDCPAEEGAPAAPAATGGDPLFD
jgi:hypothetical protein